MAQAWWGLVPGSPGQHMLSEVLIVLSQLLRDTQLKQDPKGLFGVQILTAQLCLESVCVNVATLRMHGYVCKNTSIMNFRETQGMNLNSRFGSARAGARTQKRILQLAHAHVCSQELS